MNSDLYRKSLEIVVNAEDDRSDLPYGVSLGWDEVMVVRKWYGHMFIEDATPDAGFNDTHVALSQAVLAAVEDAADTGSTQKFFDRNDLLVISDFAPTVANSTGYFFGQQFNFDFEEGMLVLPRSPSLVLFNQQASASSRINCSAHLLYQKKRVSKKELAMFMKQYKSIRLQTPPRVIDT